MVFGDPDLWLLSKFVLLKPWIHPRPNHSPAHNPPSRSHMHADRGCEGPFSPKRLEPQCTKIIVVNLMVSLGQITIHVFTLHVVDFVTIIHFKFTWLARPYPRQLEHFYSGSYHQMRRYFCSSQYETEDLRPWCQIIRVICLARPQEPPCMSPNQKFNVIGIFLIQEWGTNPTSYLRNNLTCSLRSIQLNAFLTFPNLLITRTCHKYQHFLLVLNNLGMVTQNALCQHNEHSRFLPSKEQWLEKKQHSSTKTMRHNTF